MFRVRGVAALATAAALACGPSALWAQDAGPDASLNPQTKDEPGTAAARGARRASPPPAPGETSSAPIERAAAGEGGRIDADCDRSGSGPGAPASADAGSGPRPDARADRA